MSSLHIRDIDENTLLSLKRLARRHHRSLQGELRFILEKAGELDLDAVSSGLHKSWGREDIYDDEGR